MGEEALLDPVVYDPTLADLARRIALLEQAPQVLPPVGLSPVPYDVAVSIDWYCNVTAAVFGASGASPWAAQMPRVARRGLFVAIPWITEAGTTGEVRLTAASGSAQAGTVTLPAASSGTVTYRWLHNLPLWYTSYNLDVWARRTGGANNVRIGYPSCFMVDAAGCTLTGL